MNKLASTLIEKKVKDTAAGIIKAAEETVTVSRKVLTLEIAVALLGGIVLGMFLSPRKKVTYKIASNNRINAADDEEEEEEEDYAEDEDDEDEPDGRPGKFIKL